MDSAKYQFISMILDKSLNPTLRKKAAYWIILGTIKKQMLIIRHKPDGVI